MSNLIFIVQLIQFFLGILITIPNLLLVAAVLGTARLKSASNYLLANLSFSNLCLGIILTIVNVVDRPTTSALMRPEGTIAAVNGLVNIATLLALTTNKYISIRFPTNVMSSKTSYKIIAAIWASVAIITFCKGVVASLQFIGVQQSVFDRYMAFEVALLFIFCFAVIIIYLMSCYMLYSYKKKSVHSEGEAENGRTNNQPKDYSIISTVGILLAIFLVDFLIYLGSYMAYVIYQSPDVETPEVILTIFYTQCLLTPMVIFFRDSEIWKVVKKMLMCGCTADSEFHPGEFNRVPSESTSSNNITNISVTKNHQKPTELSTRASPLTENEIRPSIPSAPPPQRHPPADPIPPVNEPVKRLPSALPPLEPKAKVEAEPKRPENHHDGHMEVREMSAASEPSARNTGGLGRPQSVPLVTIESATPREGSHRQSTSATSVRPSTTSQQPKELPEQSAPPTKLNEVD